MAPADLAVDRAKALALTPVSRETAARLDRFVAVFMEWQQRTNLIASSTEATLWTRHIADSLQLLALAPSARIWVDLGSGGGFPGLVIACALADQAGEGVAQVHLVESSTKKAAFLQRGGAHHRRASNNSRRADCRLRPPRARSDRCGDGARARALAEASVGSISPVENRRQRAVPKGTRCWL